MILHCTGLIHNLNYIVAITVGASRRSKPKQLFTELEQAEIGELAAEFGPSEAMRKWKLHHPLDTRILAKGTVSDIRNRWLQRKKMAAIATGDGLQEVATSMCKALHVFCGTLHMPSITHLTQKRTAHFFE